MILFADIETMLVNNIHKPYAIGYYKEDKFTHFMASDCNDLLIFDFLKHIILKRVNARRQFTTKKALHIYFHNLEFDGAFILDFLFNKEELHHFIQSIDTQYKLDINPIMREQKIIKIILSIININSKKKRAHVVITDSYKLLPYSLNKLGKTFIGAGIGEKEAFDHSIVTSEWLQNQDNLNKTMAYLKQDGYILRKVILEFAHRIKTLFDINIHNYPTLPSLALAIFRKKFLQNDDFIRPPSGNASEFIRSGYFGGRVDVFKPHYTQSEGHFMYSFDVNSLYPSVMMQHMPVGKPTWVKCPSDLSRPGFYKAVVDVPSNTYTPTLPIRIGRTKATERLVFPCVYWCLVARGTSIGSKTRY